MSEFIFVNKRVSPSAVALDDIAPYAQWGEINNYTYCVSNARFSERWRPRLADDHSKLVMTCGRPRLDELEISSSSDFLSLWEKQRAPASSIDGYGALLNLDATKNRLYLVIDRLGLYPVFIFNQQGVLCLSSNLFLMQRTLRNIGIVTDINKDVVAEFLATGTALHPETYITNVFQVDNGSYYEFDAGSGEEIDRRRFWSIADYEEAEYRNKNEAAEELEFALKNSVARATSSRNGRVGLMLSAGADSRAILFGAATPSDLYSYTMFDDPNAELAGAKLLAGIANSKHTEIKRKPTYYFDTLHESVMHTSGMWSLDSAHYTGVASQILNDGVDTLLTGCYADFLFKGLAMDREHARVFGKNLPIYNQTKGISYNWYPPIFSLKPSVNTSVEDRLVTRYQNITGDGHFSSVNKLMEARLTPISSEPDASGRHILRNMGVHDNIFSDKCLLDIAFSLPVDYRLNGVVFGKAVSRLIPKTARGVFNNNFGAPLDASEIRRCYWFLRGSIRRKFIGSGGLAPYQRRPDSVGTHGSWPHFPRVLETTDVFNQWIHTNADSPGMALASSLFDNPDELLFKDYWISQDRTALFLRFCVAVEALNEFYRN